MKKDIKRVRGFGPVEEATYFVLVNNIALKSDPVPPLHIYTRGIINKIYN